MGVTPNRPGKRADIHIAIEEGRLYHLNNINFVGVKLFRTPETLMRPWIRVPSIVKKRFVGFSIGLVYVPSGATCA